jgi:hypothetical protein
MAKKEGKGGKIVLQKIIAGAAVGWDWEDVMGEGSWGG